MSIKKQFVKKQKLVCKVTFLVGQNDYSVYRQFYSGTEEGSLNKLKTELLGRFNR
jgi:hypothetical protein